MLIAAVAGHATIPMKRCILGIVGAFHAHMAYVDYSGLSPITDSIVFVVAHAVTAAASFAAVSMGPRAAGAAKKTH
jgi:hypothetical protein